MNRALPYPPLAWICLGVFFMFSLVLTKVASFSFYFLLLVAFIHALHLIKKRDGALFHIWAQYGWVYVSATAILVAIVIQGIAIHHVAIRAYDIPSRLALLGLLTWGMACLPTRQMKMLRWVFMIGALIATVKLAIVTSDGLTRMPVIDFISIIALSQLTLLLAIFSVFGIVWSEKKNLLVTILLGMTGFVGLYNIYISQTRGAWISIPFFVLLIGIVFSRNTCSIKTVSWALLLVVALAGAFSTTPIVQNRVHQAFSDIHQYTAKGDADTSVGTRFQLWKASWIMFSEHPVFGVGVSNFRDSLKDIAARKIITEEAATFPHSHNEILFHMATLGIFGLFAIIATYFVPLYYFIRDMRHADACIAATAAMGVSVCLGYFIFGLVDVMFMWRICDIFYSMSIAVFLAFIIRRKYELQLATKLTAL